MRDKTKWWQLVILIIWMDVARDNFERGLAVICFLLTVAIDIANGVIDWWAKK